MADEEDGDKGNAESEAVGSPVGEIATDDLAAVTKLQEGYRAIRAEMGKIIVGQEQVLEQLLIGIFARGHCF